MNASRIDLGRLHRRRRQRMRAVAKSPAKVRSVRAKQLAWLFRVGIAATSLYVVMKKRPKRESS
jgi:hypothetical protein